MDSHGLTSLSTSKSLRILGLILCHPLYTSIATDLEPGRESNLDISSLSRRRNASSSRPPVSICAKIFKMILPRLSSTIHFTFVTTCLMNVHTSRTRFVRGNSLAHRVENPFHMLMSRIPLMPIDKHSRKQAVHVPECGGANIRPALFYPVILTLPPALPSPFFNPRSRLSHARPQREHQSLSALIPQMQMEGSWFGHATSMQSISLPALLPVRGLTVMADN